MLRRRVSLLAVLGVASVVAAFVTTRSRDARADDCTTTIASTCINDDTLWPHAGPQRFVGVGGAETIASGQIGFGLITSYLSRPIVIHTFSPGPTGSGTSGQDHYAINDQVNGTFLWGYGVSDRLELDVALPITFGQGGTGLAPITGGTGTADTAVRDMRFGLAYALLPRPRVSPDLPPSSPLGKKMWSSVVARVEMSAPTGDSGQFAGERSAVWMASLAYEFRYGRLFAGVESGVRVRPVTELLGARVGTQIYDAIGVGYDLVPHEMLSVMVEMRSLQSFVEQHSVVVSPEGLTSTPNGSYLDPAEWTVSARTAPMRGGDLSFSLGGGGEIPFTPDDLITTPRFRFTLGIRYAPLARDTDGDGVLDKDDKCPDRRGTLADEGCPHVETAKPVAGPPPGPAVHLHIEAAQDRCHGQPESADGFREDDGCPDEDSDKDGVPDRHDKCPLAQEDYAGLADGCPQNTPPPPQPARQP